ncbi:MAG: ATP-binding cassette domain-containing protein [Mycetocola sp.]
MTPELDSPQDGPDQKMQDASIVGQPSEAPDPAAKPATAKSPKATETTTTPAGSGAKSPSKSRQSAPADEVNPAQAPRKPAARKPAARKPAAKPVGSPDATSNTDATSTSPARATPRAKPAGTAPRAKSGAAGSTAAGSTAKPRAAKAGTPKAAPAKTDSVTAQEPTDSTGVLAPKISKPPVKSSRPAAAKRPAVAKRPDTAQVTPETTVTAAELPEASAPTTPVSVSIPDELSQSEQKAAPTDDVAQPVAETAPSTRPAQATPPVKRESPQRPAASSAPRSGPGKTAKRAPAKRAPLTLAAQVTSGDFAITAPSGSGKSAATSQALDDAVTAVLPVEQSPAPDVHVPPLPSLSPEEAALKFETMPEAPEQRSILDDQEPMRFVWSRRWPFLTLVSAASVPQPASTMAHDEDTDANVETPPAVAADPGEAVVEPTAPVAPEQLSDAPVADGRVEELPVAMLPAAVSPVAESQVAEPPRTEAPTVTFDSRHEADVAEHVPDPVGGAESEASPVMAEAVIIDERPASDERRVIDDPAVAAVASTSLVATLAADALVDRPASDPAVDATPEPSGDVDTVRVNELLDEIEAAEAADDTATVTPGHIDPATSPVVLRISGLSRSFGDTVAVDGIDLDVHEGSFYGIVGPNGAGKTTTLSMITGLLRPDSGSILVHGVDVWADPDTAKRSIGVLPDRLRLFDRLTGAQLLYYSGILRGLDSGTVRSRVKDLARAFGLEDALNRLVTDYSAGMTKKVALAAAMIHSPRLLVLDEPFESVDPVSAANVIEILQKYVAHGGTVVLSSHGMDLIQRVCDHVAIIVNGRVLASGAVDHVRGNGTLEERFVELAGGRKAAEGMEWLHSFSD